MSYDGEAVSNLEWNEAEIEAHVGDTYSDFKATSIPDVPNRTGIIKSKVQDVRLVHDEVRLARLLVEMDDTKDCPYCTKNEWGEDKHEESCVLALAHKIVKENRR